MKFLVVPVPSPGHLLAMVPFCWALRLAGHEVLVASRADVTAAAQRAGLDAADLPALEVPMDTLRNQVSPEMFPVPLFAERGGAGQGLWHIAAQNWHRHAVEFFEVFADLAREWGAQVIVTDPLATIGRALGAELGLPVISHRWGIDPTGGPFTERTAALVAESDIAGGRTAAAPVVTLDICPPALQAPDAVPSDLLQFIPFNGTGVLSGELRTRSDRRRAAVCFGGSVLSLTGARPLRNVVEALVSIPDLEIVVALSAADRPLLGEQPERVRVLEQVPLQLFLRDCDVLVHHGGSTTGLTGTRYGLPQLVLPQMFDQFDFARGIARTGSGIAAEDAAAQNDIDALADSARALLDDPSYRAGARKLGADIREAPAPATVVADIEARLAEYAT